MRRIGGRCRDHECDPSVDHGLETDRKRNEARWVDALERTDIPLAFVWGMLDPVLGAHMAQRIRERLPKAPFTALEDVGHWPPLEARARVAAAILNA